MRGSISGMPMYRPRGGPRCVSSTIKFGVAASDDMTPVQKLFLYAFGAAWIPNPPDRALDGRRRTNLALKQYAWRVRLSSLGTAALLTLGYAQLANTAFHFAPAELEVIFPPDFDLELLFNVAKTWFVAIFGVPATIDFYLRLTRIAEQDHSVARAK